MRIRQKNHKVSLETQAAAGAVHALLASKAAISDGDVARTIEKHTNVTRLKSDLADLRTALEGERRLNASIKKRLDKAT